MRASQIDLSKFEGPVFAAVVILLIIAFIIQINSKLKVHKSRLRLGLQKILGEGVRYKIQWSFDISLRKLTWRKITAVLILPEPGHRADSEIIKHFLEQEFHSVEFRQAKAIKGFQNWQVLKKT